MQIIGAILLLLVVLKLSVINLDNNANGINHHFQQVSSKFVEQAVNNAKVLFEKNDKEQIQQYVESMTTADFVSEAILYDETGQIIAQSEQVTPIIDLFDQQESNADNALEQIVVIQEVRTDKLIGYLRLNFVKETFVSDIQQQLDKQSESFRILLLLSAFAGFLLTRGFSLFSRQGYRVSK